MFRLRECMIKITKESNIGKDGFFIRSTNDYLFKRASFQFPPDRIIRPSSIGNCTRKIVYEMLGLPTIQTITPRIQRIFDNGTYVHKRYLKSYLPRMEQVSHFYYFKDGKLKKKDFIECSVENKEYWLRGTPDAVIFNKEDGLLYVLELKSMRQESFLSLTYPDWLYVAQVHMYMFLTGIPRSIVVYENKNDQDIKEFLVLQDQSILNKLLEKIRVIQKYVLEYPTKQILPRCECTSKYERCSERESI